MSGQQTGVGGAGKIPEAMKRQVSFTNRNSVDIGCVGEGRTYPYVRVHSSGDTNHDNIVNFVDVAVLVLH